MKSLTFMKTFMLLLCFLVAEGRGQTSIGGIPPTVQDPGSCGSPPVILMPTVNTAALLAEDSLAFLAGQPSTRFGAEIFLDTGMVNAGEWDTVLVDGDSMAVWRLTIASPGAYSMSLIFDDFMLPEHCMLYVYNSDTSEILGAFTARNNKASGRFATVPVQGDTLILEYCQPVGTAETAHLNIESVIHGYLELYSSSGTLMEFNGGGSRYCEINIRCEDGEEWCREERSVCFIFVRGQRLCSGVLVNNVRNDFTPYVLTAFHCVQGPDSDPDGTVDSLKCRRSDLLQIEKDDVENWIFVFGGIAPSCASTSGPSLSELPSFHGADYIASYRHSDFALLRLKETPGSEHGVYYSGWTRDFTTGRSQWVGIHHPAADYMKVSTVDGPIDVSTATINWSACPSDTGNTGKEHWRAQWSRGTVEPGSSGSPLYDNNHRIMGQLTGNQDIDSADWANPDGSSNPNVFCDIPHGYYGRFDVSWNGSGGSSSTSLKHWLDPDNANLLYHDGIHVPLYLYNRKIDVNRTFNVFNTIEIAGNLPPHLPFYDTQQEFSVDSAKRCTIKAARRITMKAGVHIKSGSYFRAWIGPIDCGDGNILAAGDPKVESSGSKPVAMQERKENEAVTGVARQYRTEVYPNPFRRETVIRFTLPESGSVSLKLFNSTGKEVETVLREVPYDAGIHELRYSAEHLPAGTYFYRFISSGYSETRELILLR